jgi:hypothetical protein
MSLLEHILLAGRAWTENLRKIRGMPACVGLKGFDVINLSYKQIKNGI